MKMLWKNLVQWNGNRFMRCAPFAAVPLLLALGALTRVQAAEEKNSAPPPGTVAVFELHGHVSDKPPVEDPLLGNLGAESLQDLISRLNKAAKDDKVVAVVLVLDGATLETAQVEELREAIQDVKAAKPVYAHADSLTTGQFLLLSAASRVSMAPTGDAWITGLFGEELYLRGLLDMLGVQPEFLTCGDYKSAAEMFMRKSASPAAAEMKNWLFDSLYDSTQQMIAQSRNVAPEQVRQWLDQGLFSAESAREAALIDAVESREQLLAFIKQQHGATLKLDKRYAKKTGPQIDLENPFAMMQLWAQLLGGTKPAKSTKNAIAVVHIDGPIMLGKSEPSLFGTSEAAYSEEIRKTLDKVADDPRIRAVVLRINSPGGSATASEIMLQAVQNVKTQKPVIVSMGHVAASGGYYVSCRGDRIFADATTITGSIGVVAGKLATDQMWQKIGVNFDSVQRGKRAGLMHSPKPWSDDDKREIQHWMDHVYGVFKQHVTEGRKEKLAKPIDDIAGGRVYTGAQALKLGLVDEIGTLNDAVLYAAKQVNLEDYEIRTFPKQPNFMEQLLIDLGEPKKEDDKRISAGLWSAVLPLLQAVEPERVRMVQQALKQLDFLQQERVMLTAPVLRIRQ